MPVSEVSTIPVIMHIISCASPAKILDVGAGFGKYGVLCREMLDIWGKRSDYGYPPWQTRIDCVEVFEPYITDLHRFVYDQVFIGDALELAGKIDTRYDLVLLITVLEHFTKEHGAELLRRWLATGATLLVSVPKRVLPQGALCGNPAERHLCSWSRRELSRFGDAAFFDFPWREHIVGTISPPGKGQFFKRACLKWKIKCLIPAAARHTLNKIMQTREAAQ